jgi:hypothetical protein
MIRHAQENANQDRASRYRASSRRARRRPIILRYAQTATASSGSLSALPLTVTERKRFFVREGLNLGRIGRYLEAGFVEHFINLRYLKTPLRLEKPFSVKTFASLGVLHRNSTGACITAGKILPLCMKTCPEWISHQNTLASCLASMFPLCSRT